MSNIEEKIKEDLIELYSALYTIAKMETSNQVFNDKMLRRLQYSPEEIKKALKPEKEDKQETCKKKVSNEIMEIKDKDGVKRYFRENLLKICQSDILDDEKNQILRKITLTDVNYLYEIIFELPLPKKCKKVDAVYKIKEYFDNEERTDDLIKSL